jgi:hypothetical protein
MSEEIPKPTMRSLILLLLVSTSGLAQPDYRQLTNWYYHPDKLINLLEDYSLDVAVTGKNLETDSTIQITNNATTDTGVDVFWVHPTQLINPPDTPRVIALADQPSSIILPTIIAQGALMSKYGRFYAPRYRQASPATFLNSAFSDSTRAAAMMIAYGDVKAAFLEYLETENNGNKIILAGHSQGSFLLGLLLRDLFDNDPDLRAQLVTAALGGIATYANPETRRGVWWENIPICGTANECGCIHSWRSFSDDQVIPVPARTLPAFSQALVDSGLVFRTVRDEEDWLIQDDRYYGEAESPLRYYLVPGVQYEFGGEANFLAFDGFYSARFRRSTNLRGALSIGHPADPTDQRPDDLASQENGLNFLFSGYHNKDYNIYLWALLEQIDQKLVGCSTTSASPPPGPSASLHVFPNPNPGRFTVRRQEESTGLEKVVVFDTLGRKVQEAIFQYQTVLELSKPGVYFIISRTGVQKVLVH